MRNALMASLIAGSVMIAATSHAAGPTGSAAEKLAKATAGRTAGQPVDCILLNDIRSSQIIDGTAIIYEGKNGVVYVNQPASGATFLRDGLTLVTDTRSDQLCSIDTVRLMDMPSHMSVGSVGLGQFIPYPRPGRVPANR